MAEKANSETFEEFAARVNGTNFRFAVGNSDRGFSSTWTAFSNKSDYYLGSRVFMGSQKISLHASGICRVALTDSHYEALALDGLDQPPDRAFTKWRRLATPEVGAVHVASIVFPTDFLRLPVEPRGSLSKPLFIFDAAPAGKAVEFGFFYSREDHVAMAERYARLGQRIVTSALESGEFVTIIARVTEFDRAELPSQSQMNAAPGTVLAKDLLSESVVPNLTATFWNSPGDGEALRLIEVGGISLTRSKPDGQGTIVKLPT